MSEALYAWLIWILPLIGAIVTTILGKFEKPRDYLAVLFSFISAIFATLLIPSAIEGKVIHEQVEWISAPPLSIKAGILADPLSIIMANVVAWISFLIMFYSLEYMHGERDLTRYWFFMNFFIGNMQLIVLSDNLLQLFFGWEGVGLASYALIGFWHTDEQKYWVGKIGQRALGIDLAYSPSHAGMKAFIYTKLGDISFLIGLLILFSFSGTFEFLKLAEDTSWVKELSDRGLLPLVAILIFGGAIGKSAQFPLHEWLADAMAGPTAVSALIHAATMVKAGVFLIARLGPIFYLASQTANVSPFFETVAWIGAFTAFLAATQGMVSKEVKKVLAYSTVSQIGYMMLALGVAGLSANFIIGYTAGFFHLMSHAVFKAPMFMGAGALIHVTESKFMDEMGGLRRYMRFTFLTMLLASFSLAGIPPFSGFWSKDSVLKATLYANSPSSYALFSLGLITALITAFYTFRMLGMIFFGEKNNSLEKVEEKGHKVREVRPMMWIPYLVLGVSSLILGLVGPLIESNLEHLFGGYLKESFKIEALEVVDLSFIVMASSLPLIAIGSFLGYQAYMVRRIKVDKIFERSSFVRTFHKFFDNRWYINSIYYIIFMYGILKIANGLYRFLESIFDKSNDALALIIVSFSRAGDLFDIHVIDRAINGTASLSSLFSRIVRKLQTGITEQYVLFFAIGILIVILFMLI
ncbi:MAG: NADH-quinone oxidoreductase subunit L [Nitrososphaerales archaeon]